MCRALFLVAALSLLAGHHSAAPDSAGADALAKIRSLAGEWEGPVEWSGARHDTGRMAVSDGLTGYGSAIVENLTAAGDREPSMTSVYHLDGADLRMTHCCGAQNQPRFKAQRIDLATAPSTLPLWT